MKMGEERLLPKTVVHQWLFFVGYFFITGQCSGQERLSFTHPAMGTTFRITISTEDTTNVAATVRLAFQRIDALEQRLHRAAAAA